MNDWALVPGVWGRRIGKADPPAGWLFCFGVLAGYEKAESVQAV